ncbi:is centromere binding protein at prophase [Blastomyces dermatitidis ATCC 18188]|uniref:Is centromere binding protein at prophase n=1 Tax=Ajellomyces dermatitidis (strain ATCC 18188 / CBS 674.68) TaxID=653446 RepID=F2TU57_AJEDA|nr:is centromere binding protein at prophase [Blastomyces dermatitidis ATCC 18188]
MAPKISDEDVCQAIYKFLTDGSFPEAESIVSAEFPSTAAAKELRHIAKSREEVENEISLLSRDTASDVDGWISQAKQLHEDIERSRSTAREIIRQHEIGQQLQGQVTDASKKVELLENEIAFNEAVTRKLEDIRTIDYRISSALMAIDQDDLETATGLFEEIEMLMKTTDLPPTTPVLRVLSGNVAGLRTAIATTALQKWNSLVKLDSKLGLMTVVTDDSEPSSNLGNVLNALTKLDMLDSIVDSLYRDVYSYILDPVLLPPGTEEAFTISCDGNSIQLLPQPSITQPTDIFDTLTRFLRYLEECLPATIKNPLNSKLAPPMISSLISKKLLPSMPADVDGMREFQVILEHIHKFQQALDGLGCPGSTELTSFTQQIPRIWLNQRRIKSLDEVRVALSTSSGETRKVERVETEQVSQKDKVFSENSDDWNAGWASDNEQSNDAGTQKQPVNQEDDDFSAWGLDEPDTLESEQQNKPAGGEGDEDEDAWGWGDEDEGADPPPESSGHAAQPAAHVNGGHGDGKDSPRREVTLREFYTISNIPDAIMGIIQSQVSDSEKLASAEYSNLPIASSGPALLSLPTLVTAMFKALAPMFYSQKFTGGQMFLYNDSMYFAERLRELTEAHNLPRLKSDTETLEKFGRIAYSKEMQAQRTILSDLLDGSQGFGSCSVQPYLGECENAVSATVDRMRHLHKEWQSILSPSALLQSIGSLLSTVINKMILDIEDLSDISDPESQRLAEFCNKISKLEDLFLPECKSGQNTVGEQSEAVPMTAVYVPNWLKFQYLTNILESSLADIKYLWTEGELQLEFSPGEVIDLIRALFADSDHRRRAIADIRRSSRTSA